MQLKARPAEVSLRHAIHSHLVYTLGRPLAEARDHDWYCATALAVRDRIVETWLDVRHSNRAKKKRRVYYLSIEFLIGRLLCDTLFNLGLLEEARGALAELGVELERIAEAEPDAALGNGGLGRLAACYLDSMAALGVPGYGYGIRYEHGLFEQSIKDGWQVERPETWLRSGNPWELQRPEKEYPIGFGGAVEYLGGDQSTARAVWYPAETVLACTHDVPIAGWRGRHVNILRLWSARAPNPVNLHVFGGGEHIGSLAARDRAEAISRVLYPNDSTPEGRELRLRQEYFFTSASLRDIVRRHLEQVGDIASLADYAAIQLNDTHPAIAIAELMRLLVDEHDVPWNEAWQITRATFSFTNHTLMPEALETWPVEMFGQLLPRHLQIIYLINDIHLKAAADRGLVDPHTVSQISLIDERGERRVRMAHLAFIGSHHVNGVSALHTDLLEKTVFHELAKAAPTTIVNKTNGVTFRRWLYEANPGLSALIAAVVGDEVYDGPERLSALEQFSSDPALVSACKAMRLKNKGVLADIIRERTGVAVDPASLFDIHIKRIHEYKRQSLNILEAIALYREIKANPNGDFTPRVKIFAGKAAPSYERAKLLIKLINDVAAIVNADPEIGDRLKIVFLPNYNVSLAQRLVCAADLSEQISTAGMEASGTGNMKLALNGALTIGTLDGANIEIRDNVGADNFFLFGLTADAVARAKSDSVTGASAVESSPRLAATLDMLTSGALAGGDAGRFAGLAASYLAHDPFMVAADFDAYWRAQRRVDAAWGDQQRWWQASLLNTARMSYFSSDRAVREYAKEIWRVTPG